MSAANALSDFSQSLERYNFPLAEVQTPLTRKLSIQWQVLRLDQVDPLISGNKAFKLLPSLLAAQQQQKNTLISFGGLHSNHLHALAAAGQRFGFSTVGIVRGYEAQDLSPTLLDAKQFGMQLIFVGHEEYKRRYDLSYQNKWLSQFPKAWLIPEGAADKYGLQGTVDLARRVHKSLAAQSVDYMTVAAGTGSTAAGLIDSGLFSDVTLQIFSALKKSALHQLQLPKYQQHYICDDYCFDGFARLNAELAHFIVDFEAQQNIPLDPVYTAKMLYGINDLIAKGFYPPGSHVVSIHTGGLQGRRAMQEKINRLTQRHALANVS